jgi:sugar/nucleoside kinase (ribokinase family)
MLICTLGDLLLDVIVALEAPLSGGADAPARTRIGAGGQAANVAAWVAHLGGTARFVGVRSGDAAGILVAGELVRRGVELAGPEVAAGTGTVVALVDADGERTMATDRGVATGLRAEDLSAAWFSGCDRLHLSGYSLLRSPIEGAARRAAAEARAVGARVSLDLSSWSAIRDFGPAAFRERLAAIAPDVVFANEQELDVLGGPPDAPVFVIKRGPDGCELRWPGGREVLPAAPATVVDTTGAGDAFAAGFLLGDSARDATERGLAAAAECVGRVGVMP